MLRTVPRALCCRYRPHAAVLAPEGQDPAIRRLGAHGHPPACCLCMSHAHCTACERVSLLRAHANRQAPFAAVKVGTAPPLRRCLRLCVVPPRRCSSSQMRSPASVPRLAATRTRACSPPATVAPTSPLLTVRCLSRKSLSCILCTSLFPAPMHGHTDFVTIRVEQQHQRKLLVRSTVQRLQCF